MKRIVEPNYKAKNFMVWLFVFSSFMFFSALVSAFMVQLSSSDSVALDTSRYPSGFYLSTIIILLSSATMHGAYVNGKNANYTLQIRYLTCTILLGIAFFISQFYAWTQLIDDEVLLVSDNAGDSFLYMFTGFHLLHILFGIGMLYYCILGALKRISDLKNKSRLYKTSIFWHFLDILWVYLYTFLLLY